MKLETLSRHDSGTARSILGSASLALGTREFRQLQNTELSAEVDELLTELRVKLGIGSGDTSADAISRIGSAVDKQLIEATLNKDELAKVVDRLGVRGDLPVSAYKVSFDPRDLRIFKEDGRYIERAIKSADEIHDVSWPEFPNLKKSRGVSLFLKRQHGKNKSEHWLLVHAYRDGAKLEVLSIMRVFPQVLDLEQVEGLPGMLQAFANHYGIYFSIPGVCEPTKFVINHSYVSSSPDKNEITPEPILSSDRPSKYIESGEHALSPGDDSVFASRISLAYTIDVNKYMADKTRLG